MGVLAAASSLVKPRNGPETAFQKRHLAAIATLDAKHGRRCPPPGRTAAATSIDAYVVREIERFPARRTAPARPLPAATRKHGAWLPFESACIYHSSFGDTYVLITNMTSVLERCSSPSIL